MREASCQECRAGEALRHSSAVLLCSQHSWPRLTCATTAPVPASQARVRGLEGWDVSKVKTFENMARGCTAFNVDIGDWDVRFEPPLSPAYALSSGPRRTAARR